MRRHFRVTRLLTLLLGLSVVTGCTVSAPPAPTPPPLPTPTRAASATLRPTSPAPTTAPPPGATPTTPAPPMTITRPPAPTADAPESTPTPGGALRIHTVQGRAHRSPLDGQRVTGVPGIVTAVRHNGFYIQDPTPDADDATSDGLFVFTRAAPSVTPGDAVTVSGRVREFRPGGDQGQNNLTITEIDNPVITTLSRGQDLPPPIIIGRGGRLPPTTVIENDATGDVETSGAFDPPQDGLDFYESLEGMRVQIVDAVTVGPRNRFGEIVVLADGDAGAGLRTARGGVVVRPDDFNPERIFVDDEILRLSGQNTPAAAVGDRFTEPLVGVVDYSFGNFKVQLTQPPRRAPGGLARETTDAPGPDQLIIASVNTENLDPTDVGRFEALAEIIVTHLRAPDLLSVQEIQDNNGRQDDRVVDASRTYTRLIEAIQAAGGPAYQVRQIDPVDDQDGGEPGGNIRVGFLFRTDRGLAFIDRPGGTSTAPVAVERGPNGPQLSFSPGRVDPANSAWQASRKPLAGEFTYNGQRLFVLANHFVSKGGDLPLFGRFQPLTRSSEVQRLAQATVLADFIRQLRAADAQALIVVLGDLNDFEFSRPIEQLKQAGLVALAETLLPNERYSYVFEGNAQTLDQILVSASLAQGAWYDYDVVHVNAEFPDPISDHDVPVVRLTLPRLGR